MKLFLFCLLLVLAIKQGHTSCCQSYFNCCSSCNYQPQCCSDCCKQTSCCNSKNCCQQECKTTPPPVTISPITPKPEEIGTEEISSNVNLDNDLSINAHLNMNNEISNTNQINGPIHVINTNINSIRPNTPSPHPPQPISTPEPIPIKSTPLPTKYVYPILIPIPHPYPIPYPLLQQQGCCTVIQPCMNQNCIPYQTTCGRHCASPFMYFPGNPCPQQGCAKRAYWGRYTCGRPYYNNCGYQYQDCSNCDSNFYKSYNSYSNCHGCFH